MWDGYYTANPPLAFFDGSAEEEKPDEIWVAQVAPSRSRDVPDTRPESADRRFEIAATELLERDIKEIELVNQFVKRGYLPGECKQINVERVVLDEELGLASMSNLDRLFLQELAKRGHHRTQEKLCGL